MKILAVDLGTVRTGLALSDASGFLAVPLYTVTETGLKKLVQTVADLAAEQGAGQIVVGHPRNMDGTRGESASRAEAFAAMLEKKSGLPVHLWDERLTTVSAAGYLNAGNVRGDKRKELVDTVAATVILQEFLDARRSAEAKPE